MIKLSAHTKLELVPTKPFVFDATFYNPSHYPTNDTRWGTGKRWQTMVWQGEKLGLVFKDAGTRGNPKVVVDVFSEELLEKEFLDGVKKELIWRYNLGLDLSDFYHRFENNKIVSPAIKKFYGLRPMHPGSLYEYLIIAITLQNCTVKRSVYMMQTLFERYGSLVEFDKQELWCFWETKKLSSADEAELRSLKFGYRAKSLIRVSEPFANKTINEFTLRQKGEEEQEEALLSLYGIGPASVGYIMMDCFHRFGFLKNISLWEQKIYTKLFFKKNFQIELVPVGEMLKFFDKWGKWRALAIHYVWQELWWKRRNENVPWLEKLIRL